MSDKGGVGYGSIPDVENVAAPASEPSLKDKLVAEMIGTATLVQIGCGGICAGVYMGQVSGLWQIAVVWILGGMLGVYASGSTSGGHINPAVTFSFALLRPDDFSWKDVLPYWCAQLVGGIIAGLLNLMIFCKSIKVFEEDKGLERGSAEGIASAVGFGDYWSLSPGVGGPIHAFVIEAFGTAFLLFVIFTITNTKNKVPSAAVPVLVGVGIGCMIFLLGSLTGAGINPARDIGPRIVTSFTGWGRAAYTGWWPYIFGPLVGGPIGAAVADKILFA